MSLQAGGSGRRKSARRWGLDLQLYTEYTYSIFIFKNIYNEAVRGQRNAKAFM
jgi:hypothetical protein